MSIKVKFETDPSRYRHWKLETARDRARLTMKVDEAGGLSPGYALKLNSYDLAVDIELADAVTRLRFEHPGVSVVTIDSALDGMFCAGANIFMLAHADHGFKVNFCKFTNETRLAIEDATANSGQRYVAALNGTCSGGGYELALACEEIILVDDRRSAVSLPEIALSRRAARHRRPHPPGRQAQGAARPRRRLRHAGRGRARRTRGQMGPGRRGGAALALQRGGGRAGRVAGRLEAGGTRRCHARRARTRRERD